MKTLSIKEYTASRGAKSELARRFNLTAGAISNMLVKGRNIVVVFENGEPKHLVETRHIATAAEPGLITAS